MGIQHERTAWKFIKSRCVNVQLGQFVLTCSMDMHHGSASWHAAWACSMNVQHEHAEWKWKFGSEMKWNNFLSLFTLKRNGNLKRNEAKRSGKNQSDSPKTSETDRFCFKSNKKRSGNNALHNTLPPPTPPLSTFAISVLSCAEIREPFLGAVSPWVGLAKSVLPYYVTFLLRRIS